MEQNATETDLSDLGERSKVEEWLAERNARQQEMQNSTMFCKGVANTGKLKLILPFGNLQSDTYHFPSFVFSVNGQFK